LEVLIFGVGFGFGVGGGPVFFGAVFCKVVIRAGPMTSAGRGGDGDNLNASSCTGTGVSSNSKVRASKKENSLSSALFEAGTCWVFMLEAGE
jgi:hypothetical protein